MPLMCCENSLYYSYLSGLMEHCHTDWIKTTGSYIERSAIEKQHTVLL